MNVTRFIAISRVFNSIFDFDITIIEEMIDIKIK